MDVPGVPNLSWLVRQIAKELSTDLGPGLNDRAARELDENLDGDQLRSLAVQWIVDMARDYARSRTAAVERAATDSSAFPAALPTAAVRIRPVKVDPDFTIEGHVGNRVPGSTGHTNKCRSCVKCTQANRPRKSSEELWRETFQAFAEYERDLKTRFRVEWTAELLSAEIAMPDGTRTTWGDATLEQHRVRHDMLAHNAMVNMENAARHSLAMDLLTETGAANLNGALEVVA